MNFYKKSLFSVMVVMLIMSRSSVADHHGGGFDPGQGGGSGFHHGGGSGHQSYPHVHPKYHYGYGVKDSYKGLDFGHHETRDGHSTQGGYHVLLPDGRLQTVTYVADGYSGFVAEVTYSGVPHYPPPPPPQHEPVYQNSYHG